MPRPFDADWYLSALQISMVLLNCEIANSQCQQNLRHDIQIWTLGEPKWWTKHYNILGTFMLLWLDYPTGRTEIENEIERAELRSKCKTQKGTFTFAYSNFDQVLQLATSLYTATNNPETK